MIQLFAFFDNIFPINAIFFEAEIKTYFSSQVCIQIISINKIFKRKNTKRKIEP